MGRELTFEQDIPAGPYTLRARGKGEQGLYGRWHVTVSSDMTFMGMTVSQRFTFDFTTAEGAAAPVTGNATVKIGTEVSTPMFVGMDLDEPLTGTATVVPGAGGKPDVLRVTAEPAGELKVDTEVAFGDVAQQFSMFGPGGSHTFDFELPAGLRAELRVPPNDFGDQLPVIPRSSRVVDCEVRYRQQVAVTVLDGDDPVPGVELRAVWEAGDFDLVDPPVAVTDDAGEARFVVETQRRGPRRFDVAAEHDGKPVPHVPLDLHFWRAWYDSPFEITGYTLAMEKDFSGKPVTANGLDEEYDDAFLYSGTGVVMQGTGKGRNGKLVKYTGSKAKWLPKYRWVADESVCTFKIVAKHTGRAGRELAAGRSIAVDPGIVPLDHWVEIVGPPGRKTGVGLRQADDTGGKIRGRHIDDYVGLGDDAMQKWGGTFTANVKYLGPKPS